MGFGRKWAFRLANPRVTAAGVALLRADNIQRLVEHDAAANIVGWISCLGKCCVVFGDWIFSLSVSNGGRVKSEPSPLATVAPHEPFPSISDRDSDFWVLYRRTTAQRTVKQSGSNPSSSWR